MIVEIMGGVLELDHVACKEAALHGLAHWQVGLPDEVRSVIERHSESMPPLLRDYASAAKVGNLQ
ncbi:hypothetical protein OU995_06065 [Roseateles sp. SL47]|uniref:hypothetical protein n=1 Tax=Roseateles sp. SL47 TaxID=2995138 RepID=UPI002270C446|nr:hypothetical protein [Roseateles sp. SL47]WAC74284.1 hypothetical protein OU995_06065 [Roseateles sp. SL47]